MVMHIPYHKQEKDYTCGPAVLRMALGALGKKYTERHLGKLAGTTAQHGTPTYRLQRVLYKMDVSYISGYRRPYSELGKYVEKGITIIDWMPQVIFPQHPEFQQTRYYNPEEDSHYAIVLSAGKTWTLLRDPVLGRQVRVTRKDFLRAWRDPRSKSRHWMLAVLP